MAVARCPKCDGRDLRPNTGSRLRNSHHCNGCGHDFPLWATGIIVPTTVTAVIGQVIVFSKALVDLWDDAKKLLGDGDRPQPAQPQARAAIPPLQPPSP
jgi:uncharacterized protein (DUF983 family)